MNDTPDHDLHTAARATNNNMHAARRVQNDEFYTQLSTIENEMQHYTKYFRGKVILCNCDDPRASQFRYFFRKRFAALGLKKLITTCYQSKNADLFSDHECKRAVWLEYTGEGRADRHVLKGDGDFRSDECINLLKQADIVVTNPPFSLFREYIAQLIEHDKKFLIIGNFNAITYTEVFPLIKANQVWLGVSPRGMDFKQPDESLKNVNATWYTNLLHKKRNEELELYKPYDSKEYPTYDNYAAIHVERVNDIPNDYAGPMGVPITFMDYYNPDQFEIIGCDYDVKAGLLPELVNPNWDGKFDRAYLNGKRKYAKLLIKHKMI